MVVGSHSNSNLQSGIALERAALTESQISGGKVIVAERENGTVKWFNNTKGYGFITRDSGGDIFVHYSAITGEGYRSLNEGQRVEFAVVEDTKGPRAHDVVALD